ncbi:uncharacterized protein K452DRAFT_287209 [Aplosporella prunicola CBS 121167]|uniref:Gcp-like domain-containing protein n=1 Tax=Aplosporella prunicola CBS 121167 TaxID=1176127 RepID=A0A6A6BCT7_9PEZI|nr:uncharacterized protein K452DRAFT_287209 [Aplosporella prunicola CBS 121167]KAF2142012.1 hypothetical protein K452DRAFT_287209 [Aplosporella prunicola CBS 121167]
MLRHSTLRLARPLRRNLFRPITAWIPRRELLTLAIETSCDDTSAAVLETKDNDRKPDEPAAVLHFHKKVTADNTKFLGVHPVTALESHQENLAILVQEAIKKLPAANDTASSSTSQNDASAPPIRVPVGNGVVEYKQRPDFVSVTRGPGMRSNLFTGLDTAKGLAVAWQVPFVGVNHMHAHALTPRLASALAQPSTTPTPSSATSASPSTPPTPQHDPAPAFPFLSVLVSGGHTLLIHSSDLTSHKVLGSTIDTAIGESLDKIARAVVPASQVAAWGDTMYGALLEEFAFPSGAADFEAYYTPPTTRKGELKRRISPTYGWALRPPLSHSPTARSLDMSFSGLATMLERLVEFGWDVLRKTVGKETRAPEEVGVHERRELAREAMRIAFEHLAGRVVLALEGMEPEKRNKIRTVVVSGGVASNKFLRFV